MNDKYKQRSKQSTNNSITKAEQLESLLGTKSEKTLLPITIPDDTSTDDQSNECDHFSDSDSDSDASPAENVKRKWIVDTGCGFDLIGKNDVEGNFDVQKSM